MIKPFGQLVGQRRSLPTKLTTLYLNTQPINCTVSWAAGKNLFKVSKFKSAVFLTLKVFHWWMFHENVPRVGIDYNNKLITDRNN